MDDSILLRDNLRGEMARRHKNQADLARAMGCQPQAVSKKFSGESDFTVSDLKNIAGLFGMTLMQLIMLLLQPIDSIKSIRQ